MQLDLSTPPNEELSIEAGVSPSQVIEVRPVQPEKAFSSISVTLFGIVIEAKLVQFPKAPS